VQYFKCFKFLILGQLWPNTIWDFLCYNPSKKRKKYYQLEYYNIFLSLILSSWEAKILLHSKMGMVRDFYFKCCFKKWYVDSKPLLSQDFAFKLIENEIIHQSLTLLLTYKRVKLIHVLIVRAEELLKTLRVPYEYHLISIFTSKGLIFWKNRNGKFFNTSAHQIWKIILSTLKYCSL